MNHTEIKRTRRLREKKSFATARIFQCVKWCEVGELLYRHAYNERCGTMPNYLLYPQFCAPLLHGEQEGV